MFLRGFTLSENVSVPECVTALTATPADDRTLSVNLQWTLPSLDTDGNPLAEPIESVMLSRDGAEIATLPGSDESYTDTEATGLDSGFHTYQVRVVCGGQTSRPAEVATSYVGPVKPMELPFADDMEKELMWSLWTVLDPDGDAASGNPSAYIWSRWANTALTGNQLVYSNTGASNAENDWAFTPALAFNARGTYILTFDACMYNAYASTCNLDIYLTPDAETASEDAEPIASFQTFQSATYPKDGEKVEITFSISEPGAYRIAFHEHAEAARRQVRLDNFSVTVGELAPPLIPADFTLSAEAQLQLRLRVLLHVQGRPRPGSSRWRDVDEPLEQRIVPRGLLHNRRRPRRLHMAHRPAGNRHLRRRLLDETRICHPRRRQACVH